MVLWCGTTVVATKNTLLIWGRFRVSRDRIRVRVRVGVRVRINVRV